MHAPQRSSKPSATAGRKVPCPGTQPITLQGLGFEQNQAGIDFPAPSAIPVFRFVTAKDGDPRRIAVNILSGGAARRQL
jgi:hypothetical protein